MRVQRLALAAIVVGALVPGGSALAATDPIDAGPALPDRDVRSGALTPTAGQRTVVRATGAQVAWNAFGTPSSLVVPGGTLAAGVAGAAPAAAARTWLDQWKRLFRLRTLSGLELASDNALAGGAGHAVTFRQTVGSLKASGGGLVTLGVTGTAGAWKIVSVSGTIRGDQTLAGQPTLGAEQALQRAAAEVGQRRSLAQIDPVRRSGLRGWRGFRITGASDVQRTRAVAFPTVHRGYLAAYEVLLVDTGGAEPTAYRTFVDARSGAVLARESLVDAESDQETVQAARTAAAPAPADAAAAAPQTFAGTLPPQDGGCDTRKGPYTVAAGAGVRAIDVFANADTPAQDIVLKLFRGSTQVAEADTLRTPERIRYAPAGGVPTGDYFAQVCEFQDTAPPAEPRTYRGTITLDTSAPPAPYTARWLAFGATPPLNTLARDPWNNPGTDTREHWCWKASTDAADCDRVVGNLASRTPWDHDVKLNAPSHTTTGNNARSAESWTDPLVPSANQFRPVSPARDYAFPWTNAWHRSDCDPGTPYGTAFRVGQSFDISAAVTNLFVQHNRMHDWSYRLGFTEENWNAQDSNFGLTETFRENDPVVGDAQAGAALPPPVAYTDARNNANMITLPDGSPSVTNMYLWQPVAGGFYPPCVDGDYDAGVIGHEYTHMIENRMIGKGANRSGFAAGTMGEAVADLLSIEQLNENGLVPTDGENRYATGTYVTGNKLRGIRNYAPNFPSQGAFPTPSTYPEIDPLNFSDIGYDTPGPEVHSDGEIWVAVNFDIRRALAAKYGAQYPEADQALQQQCADGAVAVESCPGNRRWIQLVLDSFLLMRTDPSMIDARNAILAADTMRFGGADQPELWLAFARRGLGRGASGTNGPGRTNGVESDTDPLPDFASPTAGNARVTFTAAGQAGAAPVRARVYVGHYEARVSPVADTDDATSAPRSATTNNLDASADFAPGTYEFVATAPGYGAIRFRRTFRAGQRQVLTLRFAPNWASKSQGATASGDATRVTSPTSVPPGREILSAARVRERLIDDTEATDWQAAARQAGTAWTVDGRNVTVDLAGARPHTINRVQVSALLGPVFDPHGAPTPADLLQNRYTALRRFELSSCNSRVADCSASPGFHRIYASAADAFPADAPRPVAPMLLMRGFAFAPVQATHLRLVVRDSQCTGGPAYQGEQDADPHNATDCNTAGAAATRFVRVAELQAFGGAASVQAG
jgi:extracellular elastinolytic metalloproteinase